MLLQRADAPASAAELLGALERDDATYGEEAERLAAVRTWVHAELGEDAFAARVAAGAEREITAAATWALEILTQLRR